jgi:hypothetical protein
MLDQPHLSREQLAERLSLPLEKVAHALRGAGFGQTADDLRPCGDPVAHDRLLIALRRSHPAGAENAREAYEASWHPGADGWRSLTGFSASMAADAA